LPYTMFSAIKAIELAKSKLGTPYGLDNLDCSGFMRFIFAPFGIVLPYYAREIAQKGREISKVEIREGDLVFYGGGPGREQTVNHVGMVISVNKAGFEFIHSTTSKGISTNKSAENYYKSRFLFARRIFDF
jgi:cell wall-associated NlpC family hydrolase